MISLIGKLARLNDANDIYNGRIVMIVRETRFPNMTVLTHVTGSGPNGWITACHSEHLFIWEEIFNDSKFVSRWKKDNNLENYAFLVDD